MAGTHCSDDDLLDRLYGLGREDGHLEACQDCRQRWLELQESRRTAIEDPAVPVEWMAAQRRQIWQRIERPKQVWWRQSLAPVAMALTFAIAVLLQSPAPQPQPTIAQSNQVISDAALFEDVFQQVQRTSPESLAPVQRLFEENQ
jgi:hypothetical protein